MPEDIQGEIGDAGTTRPLAPAQIEKGDYFEPFECPFFGTKIHLPQGILPSDALGLFTLYFPLSIMQILIEYTNLNSRVKAKLAIKDRSRAKEWYDTNIKELYTYLAITIYMALHKENKIEDFWDTKEFTPDYPISRFMPRDRFQLLHVNFRISDPE
jgi:hypothetical protein